MQQRLDARTWVVLRMDGLQGAGHLVVAALVIDADGPQRGGRGDRCRAPAWLQDGTPRGLT